MNLSIIDITPLSTYLSPITPRPPDTKEFNYKSLIIEEDDKYYYWSRGVSLPISKDEYRQVRSNPKLFYSSITYDLHEKTESILKGAHGE